MSLDSRGVALFVGLASIVVVFSALPRLGCSEVEAQCVLSDHVVESGGLVRRRHGAEVCE